MEPITLGLTIVATGALVRWLRRSQPNAQVPPLHFPARSTWVNPAELGFGNWVALRDLPAVRQHYLTAVGVRPDIDFLNAEVTRGQEATLDAIDRVLKSLNPVPLELEPEGPGVHFRSGDPETFDDMIGQERILSWYRVTVRQLPDDQWTYPHQLFVASAGQGKTTLAKVFANEWRLRFAELGRPEPGFIQIVASDLTDASALDRYMERVAAVRGSILFIDEIHALKYDLFGDKLLMALDERMYQFVGDQHPTSIPDFTVLGGTTDYGELHLALKRRFEVKTLERLTREQLMQVLLTRPFSISPNAAERLVHFTHWDGAPWYALQLRNMAERVARVRGQAGIDLETVQLVVQTEDLDELGLRPLDRAVLTELFKCPRQYASGQFKGQTLYVASERNICAMAHVNPTEYAEVIRPRLMARGLVLSLPQGQALTPLAIARYGRAA